MVSTSQSSCLHSPNNETVHRTTAIDSGIAAAHTPPPQNDVPTSELR